MTDAAILLGVLAGHDPNDRGHRCLPHAGQLLQRLHAFPRQGGAAGARIAVPPIPGQPRRHHECRDRRVARTGRARGEVPALAPQLPGCPSNVFPPVEPWPPAGCASALFYGFKRDLNAYLATLGPGSMVQSLAEVIAFNTAHAAVALKYGQILAQLSDSIDISPGSADTAQYTASRAQDIVLSRGALDFVYNGPDGSRARPTISMRCCFPPTAARARRRRRAIPASRCRAGSCRRRTADRNPIPVGRDVLGPRFQRAEIDRTGYAFEQATSIAGRRPARRHCRAIRCEGRNSTTRVGVADRVFLLVDFLTAAPRASLVRKRSLTALRIAAGGCRGVTLGNAAPWSNSRCYAFRRRARAPDPTLEALTCLIHREARQQFSNHLKTFARKLNRVSDLWYVTCTVCGGVQMAQSKVRYAVVGLGYIAQVAVLPAFAHAKRNSWLHALVSGDPEKLRELGDKYGP